MDANGLQKIGKDTKFSKFNISIWCKWNIFNFHCEVAMFLPIWIDFTECFVL